MKVVPIGTRRREAMITKPNVTPRLDRARPRRPGTEIFLEEPGPPMRDEAHE
jgi:hypothetical protein